MDERGNARRCDRTAFVGRVWMEHASCRSAFHRLTGLLGDLIFLVSAVCMKDGWRAGIPDTDKTELVTTGVYRFSRNPAFLEFDFMYIGVLLLYFNPLTAAFTLFSVIMLHLQVLQEERYLTAAFVAKFIRTTKSTCSGILAGNKKQVSKSAGRMPTLSVSVYLLKNRELFPEELYDIIKIVLGL